MKKGYARRAKLRQITASGGDSGKIWSKKKKKGVTGTVLVVVWKSLEWKKKTEKAPKGV